MFRRPSDFSLKTSSKCLRKQDYKQALRLRFKRLAPFLATLAVLGVFAFAAPHIVHAQATTDALTSVGDATGLGGDDPRVIVARIIRTVITLLGVLAVLIVLYGGFVWMTAGGNEEKIEKAKKILIRGSIGLAIILMSWAITTFVITALLSATQGGGGGGSNSSGNGGSLGGGSTSSFIVTDFSPDSAVAIRNIQLRVTFSKNLDATTAGNGVTVTNGATGAQVDGVVSASGNHLTFVPSAACPTPNEDRFCFDADTAFTVSVSGDIRSSTGTKLVCSGDRCTSSFTSGNLVDTENPVATLSNPEDGDGVPTDSSQAVQATATDDSEVSSGEFLLDTTAFDSVGAAGDDLGNVILETALDTGDMQNGSTYRLSVVVTDIAGNTDTDVIQIDGRPAWCFNGALDTDRGETGIDCGGDTASNDYCGACDGSSCTSDAECSSGSCVDGVCATLPEITRISPDNGAVGSYVTIAGTGFGSLDGTVAFTAADGGTVEADIPSCSSGWSSTEIVVEVPTGAVDGPITLTTSSDRVETTDDDNGAVLADFDVNDVVRPKLCSLSPNDGASTDAVTLAGLDFGDTQNSSTVTFGTTAAGTYTSWADTRVAITVPSLSDDDYDVVVSVDGIESNAVTFTVEASTQDAPTISGVDPESGAIGDYITIAGNNFGTSTGTVWFESAESGLLALGSMDFPAACDGDTWGNSEITVIVPDVFQNAESVTAGSYTIYIEDQNGSQSNAVDFTVTDGEPSPGICSLTPESGASGDTVVIAGERLGSTAGAVTFYSGVAGTVTDSDWSSTEITVLVPAGTATGPVAITSSAGAESNTLNFSVGASSTSSSENVTAAAYGWYFSSGSIPETPELIVDCSDTVVSAVPNERFTAEVCTNAVVYGEFSTLMNEGSVGDAVSVEECTAGGDQPCDTTVDVAGAATVASSATMTYFQWVPTATTFSADTIYLVTVSTAATSASGVAMAADVSWNFTTAATETTCRVSAVHVSPSASTIAELNGTDAFHALPISGCVVTNASSYTWDWTVNNSFADFAASSDGTCDAGTTSCATVEALAEGVTPVTAEETDSNIDGSSTLTIAFSDPYVENFEPNCDAACSNAAIAATFNIGMDDATVEAPGAVTLYTCANELCANLTEYPSYTVACVSTTEDATRCDKAVITIGSDLVADTYYRVIVSGDVESASGVPLTRTNYNGDYSWTYKVKDGVVVCSTDRVSLTPAAATATVIGQRQTFTAVAYGPQDSCSVAGQELTAADFNWSWTNPIADDGADAAIPVAEWWNTATVDTDVSGIATGCTGSCIAGGSNAYEAICGDTKLGTGEECEDGNTVNGDGCSSLCLREGGDVVGVCGNGTLERNSSSAGEDCDDSNTRSGDGCSATCLNEGATQANTTCGNNDVGYAATLGGEDCDDGNVLRGDGCDSQCLNEGSPTLSSLGGALCGNGVVDAPYENCDTALSSQGCSSTCLLEGASALYTTPSICGDTRIGTGEECDEGDALDGDGCSSDCLLEGSSTSFTVPSFCGDGAVGTGELAACEASGGDTNVDALQLAFISDAAAEEVSTSTHEANATIVVTEPASGVGTTGTFTLSCTAASDEDCPNSTTYGVGTANCCMERPTVTLYPNGSDVCRNAMMYGVFTKEMNTASFMTTASDGSATPRMYAALDLSTTTDGLCPSDHTSLVMAPAGSWAARAWFAVRQFVAGATAHADTGDCVAPIDSFSQTANADGTYTVRMRYTAALVANANYTLHLDVDADNTDGVASGVTSRDGVALYDASGKEESTFTTGSDICTLDELQVEDTDDSANYFSATGEDHVFTVTALSYATGEPQEISPIAGVYDWSISSWSEDTSGAIFAVTADATDATNAAVTAEGENGSGNILATATVTADVIGGTTGDTVVGSADATANLCVNPWPAVAAFPWEDATMGIALHYCRDAGDEAVTTDDYPVVTAVQAARRPISGDTVIKEYLFEVAGSTDAIGLRVVSNEHYLSPAAWYAAQGFTGTPAATIVDGFEAVTDGRTTYVSAPNAEADIYSNIYVLSYNEGASDETIEIYDQMVAGMSLVTSLEDTALCYTSSGTLATSATTGEVVACTSDSDCNVSTAEYCGDMKAKLQRDTKRLADLTTISAAIAAYGDDNGMCSATVSQSCATNDDCPGVETCEAVVPTLGSGTFVRSLGASAWTSWSDLLGEAIGLDESIVDPLNAYEGCGTGTLADYNATTCVNSTNGTYVCPSDSHVYHYRPSGAQSYSLYADLEYSGAYWENPIDEDVTDGVSLYASSENGDNAYLTGFTIDPFCDSTVYGGTGTCGDGVVNTDANGTVEICEIGEVGGATTACDSDNNGTDDGTESQACNSVCTGFTADADAVCIPAACGNAVIDAGETCDDGDYNGRYGYCSSLCDYASATYCGDGALSGSEVCDCGAASLSASPTDARPYGGTPGTCSGVNGVYDSNVNTTCAWDCQGPASYCGDGTIDSGEVCDGGSDSWEGALCNINSTAATFGEACTSDDDCERYSSLSGADPLCGGEDGTGLEACPEATICVQGSTRLHGTVCDTDDDCGTGGVCSVATYQTYRTRTCDSETDGASCTWSGETSSGYYGTACTALGSCGDGVVNGGEECDDGNDASTDSCTNECTSNVCGDGYLYDGEEQCDEGAANGAVCDASYESSCTGCSIRCTYSVASGEFCGDGVINGHEYCDAFALPYSYYDAGTDAVYGTCSTLGRTVVVSGVTYTCRDLGICNGSSDNGAYCTNVTGADVGTDTDDRAFCSDCVRATCRESCASSCPFTYSSASLLVTSNEPGARASTGVDLYAYSDSTTSEIPNAATVTIPACSVASGITADVSFDDIALPDVYVAFIIDESSSMGYTFSGSSTTSETDPSRFSVAQELLADATSRLFDELESVQTSYIHFSSSASLLNYCTSDDTNSYLCNANEESDALTIINDRMSVHTSGSAYTDDGITLAQQLFDDHTDAGDGTARKIAVLLTDGTASSGHDPLSTAATFIDAGYELYTIALTTVDDTQTEINRWSSNSSVLSGVVTAHDYNQENLLDYSYVGSTADDLADAYEAIIDSITQVTISIISSNGATSTVSSGTAAEGSSVALPWPATFACDGSGEQDLPLRVSFIGVGQIGIRNVKVNYCAP